MQGAFELVLLGIAFLGLQAWWLSKVFLNRSRQSQREALQRLFDQ